ncbi:Predicted protein [Taphrina deformans PYCC 5710]|uniref:Nucleotide exchange factor SIL1 n=1 Tax=Taphrina deformans (strain PYCC 5710 / ATCC 11124 / CBS 356.35 / IMI 108563 / JCM 9778 / NBRC 8474) TaxID=1097556 RepID=R4XFN9_TAPDE|nr:Predicted protein [Taphrina deformans PYCC 5710]|eukprot:CCG83302.1 Predicted protein [Taphrina deformans PYCC 5710]
MFRTGIVVLVALARLISGTFESETSREICHGDLCYPAIFVPSSEFAVVHDDQSIPPGLNVRINLETGVKEARLLSSSDDEKEDVTGDLAIVPGEEVHETSTTLTEHKEKPFPPTKPLDGSDRPTVLSALDSLEDLVHELEFGLELVKSADALSRLLHFLQDSSAICRAKAALVLGSALQNNENAVLAIPAGFSLTSQLLRSIDAELGEQNDETKKMLVYALSASMALPRSKAEYGEGQGHDTLSRLYTSGPDDVRAKIASFVEDHFAQKPVAKNSMIVQDDTDWEGGLGNIDALETWCNTFQRSLLGSLSTVVARTKLMSALCQIKRTDRELCTALPHFLDHLAKESLKDVSDSTEEVVELAREARILFGNHKASRKHSAAYL